MRGSLLVWLRLDEKDRPSSPTCRIDAEVDAATGKLTKLRVRHIDLLRIQPTHIGVTGWPG